MMRHEFKYYVPELKYWELRKRIAPFLQPDPHAGSVGGRYTVRSIYFDTQNFEHYFTKIDGLAHRLKVRLRGYNIGDENSEVFFEIKRKYEGPILKNRSNMPFGVAQKLLAGASVEQYASEINRLDDARRFLYQYFARQMRPIVNVIYEREAYFGVNPDPDNNFRLTLDLNLRCVAMPKVADLYKEHNPQYANPGFFILEVKFNQYCPKWIKPIIENMHLYREAASKYTNCIDKHPDIQPGRKLRLFAWT